MDTIITCALHVLYRCFSEDDFILNFVMDANININFDFSMIGEILGETGQVISPSDQISFIFVV